MRQVVLKKPIKNTSIREFFQSSILQTLGIFDSEYPDLTPIQFQYWTSLVTSLISLLIQSYDHVTFYI